MRAEWITYARDGDERRQTDCSELVVNGTRVHVLVFFDCTCSDRSRTNYEEKTTVLMQKELPRFNDQFF